MPAGDRARPGEKRRVIPMTSAMVRWTNTITIATSCALLLGACERSANTKSNREAASGRFERRQNHWAESQRRMPRSAQVAAAGRRTARADPRHHRRTIKLHTVRSAKNCFRRKAVRQWNGSMQQLSTHGADSPTAGQYRSASGTSSPRNSPTILNALYNRAQFWDGRAGT
jgi:cytochrome c peroxidase